MEKEKKINPHDYVVQKLAAAGLTAYQVLSNHKTAAYFRTHYISDVLQPAKVNDVLLAIQHVAETAAVSRVLAAAPPATAPGPWIQLCCAGTPAKLAEMQAIMDSWIWQVKRKMAGRRIPRCIMPVFTGEQNDGKSYLVTEHIFRQFDPCLITDNADLDMLNNTNDRRSIGSSYLVLFDEMAGARKVEMNKLKNFITATHIDGRQMYGAGNVKTPQLASLIGTSNLPLSGLIADNTGMTRFYEIAVDKAVMFANRGARDAYDWSGWVASIDVNGEDPRAAFAASIAAVQADLKNDTVGLWVEDADAVTKHSDRSTLAEMFEDYQQYCRTCAFPDKLGRNKFAEELRQRGWTAVKGKYDRKMRYTAPEDAASIAVAAMLPPVLAINGTPIFGDDDVDFDSESVDFQ